MFRVRSDIEYKKKRNKDKLVNRIVKTGRQEGKVIYREGGKHINLHLFTSSSYIYRGVREKVKTKG